MLPCTPPCRSAPASVGTFLALGAAAGMCAQCVVYPLDVVRRRVQLNKLPPDMQTNKQPVTVTRIATTPRAAVPVTGTGVRLYTWMALRSVVRADGPASLYAGIVPTMLKVAPAVAVSVTCRDHVLGRLD